MAATAAGWILGQIRLVEHDDRHRARLPHQRQISFDPARAQVLCQRGHEKDRIDVGGDDLFVHRPAGGFSRHRTSPIKTAMNDGRAGV